MAGQIWSLKIFSGAHIGAETDLEQGSCILGSHEDCDFVLTDDFIAEQQVEITVSESGITVKSLCGQALSLDGQSVEESCAVKKHQMVTISGLNFAFGISGEPWPSLSAVMSGAASVNSGQASTIGTENGGNNSKSGSTEERSAATNHEASVDNTATAPFNDGLEHFKENKNSSSNTSNFSLFKLFKSARTRFYKYIHRHYLLFLCGIGLIGILCALSFSFYWLWQKTAPDEMQRPINHIEIAENIRKKMDLFNINFRQLADGFIMVSGYLTDNGIKNQLLQALNEKEVPVKLQQLFVMSDMRVEAVQALKTAGYSNIQIGIDTTPGSLVLSGYAPNQKYVVTVREILNAEVSGLLYLVEQIEFQFTRQKTLYTMLQEYGLSSQIKLLEQENKIILKGRLENVSEGYYFKKVVHNFKEKYGKNPELVIDVTIPSVSMNTLKPKLKIKSVSLGHIPYVILEDGQKYLSGARLENGYILESIGLDYLVLSLGKQRIKYYVRNNNE